MARSTRLTMGVLTLVLLACRADEGARQTSGTTPDTSDYWSEVAAECRTGSVALAAPDTSTLRGLVACARSKKFKNLKDGRWVGDEQLLTACSDPDDVSTCTPVTWAVAVPVDRLEKIKDRDFDRGAVVVASIVADRDYPESGSKATIRGGGNWVNYVNVQHTGTTWQAFLVATDTVSGAQFFSSLGEVERTVHQDSTGRVIDPPGHVLWWFKPDVESMVKQDAGGADDGLWTRCGTGCCSISGFRLAK
jgi:hypothetical protein